MSEQVWQFYLSDADRNSGWSNHTFVLQYVCSGTGPTPQEAWEDAIANGRVPDGYLKSEAPDHAFREEHCAQVALVTPPVRSFTCVVTYDVDAQSVAEAECVWEDEGPEVQGRVTIGEQHWETEHERPYRRVVSFELPARGQRQAESRWEQDGPEIGSYITLVDTAWATSV